MNRRTGDDYLKRLIDEIKESTSTEIAALKEFESWVKNTALAGMNEDGTFHFNQVDDDFTIKEALDDIYDNCFGNGWESPEYEVDGNLFKLTIYTNSGGAEEIEWDLEDSDLWSNLDDYYVLCADEFNIDYDDVDGVILQANTVKLNADDTSDYNILFLTDIFSPREAVTITSGGRQYITDDYTKARVRSGLPICLPDFGGNSNIFYLVNKGVNGDDKPMYFYTTVYDNDGSHEISSVWITLDGTNWLVEYAQYN